MPYEKGSMLASLYVPASMDAHFFFDWYAYACYDLVYYGYCGYASFDDCATVRTERIVIGQCIDVLVTCVQ